MKRFLANRFSYFHHFKLCLQDEKLYFTLTSVNKYVFEGVLEMKVVISKELSIENLDSLGNVYDLAKEILFDGLALSRKTNILGDQPAWNLTRDTVEHEEKLLELVNKLKKINESMGA